jgi:hypothetical protein
MTETDQTLLHELLQRWTADGIITPDQAARMRTYVDAGEPAAPAHPTPAHRPQLVVEALGYLGGAIVVAGAALIAAQYWDDLDTAWRLAALGATTLVLLAAGAAVPDALGAAGDRMRSVLWLASTAAFSGFLAVLAEGALELGSQGNLLLISSGCALYATALYALPVYTTAPYMTAPYMTAGGRAGHRAPLQQVAMMLAFALTASALINFAWVSDDLPGLGAWAVGLAWAFLGRGGVLVPGRLAVVLGSATAVFGAMLTGGSDAGMVLTLLTVVAVVGAAVAVRDLALLAVGSLGALASVPAAMTKWFPDSAAAAYALVLVGGLLVAVAVVIARRGMPERRTRVDPAVEDRAVKEGEPT